jgi:hypothetical protein
VAVTPPWDEPSIEVFNQPETLRSAEQQSAVWRIANRRYPAAQVRAGCSTFGLR